MTDTSDSAAVRRRFADAGQAHVFRFLDELTPDRAAALLSQAAEIDLDDVQRLVAAVSEDATADRVIAPPGDELVLLGDRDLAAAERGEELLRDGRVAVVIAAGGQGTRLGSPAPKAMWPAGPTTGKPLLQWLAEKVAYWTRRVGRRIPLVLMVSDATEKPTHDFLRWHRYFGLDPTWVRLAKQGTNPVVDDEGRLVLAARDRIATAPNGHGGLYRALADSSVLGLLSDHGVTSLSYVQVDNPLIQPVDLEFLGLHAAANAEISSKCVAKRHAGERVGVFARVDGRPAIVEYSELSTAQAEALDDHGRLLYGQGSIAAHVIDTEFATRMAELALPVHGARKAVDRVGDDGVLVKADGPNATKFETFLFDAIPLAARTLVVETSRAHEFSPIKNAAGDDSPATARDDLNALFRGWYERAGLPVPAGNVEVDPSQAPHEAAFRALHGLDPR